MVLFRPLWDVLFSVPSLQIKLYSCCFNHSSGFGSVGSACVKMFIVTVFLSCLVGVCIWGCVESVRCSISLCLQARCVYPTYWVCTFLYYRSHGILLFLRSSYRIYLSLVDVWLF